VELTVDHFTWAAITARSVSLGAAVLLAVPLAVGATTLAGAAPTHTTAPTARCAYLNETQARGLLGSDTMPESQSPANCNFVKTGFPTAPKPSYGALLQVVVQRGSGGLVQDELNPDWSPPSPPKGDPSLVRHFTKFEGTRIAYVAAGNPDRVRLTSTGEVLPEASIYAERSGDEVLVVVQGHTHPLAIAKHALTKVFART
jgi:hypothetical protein